MVSHKQKRLWRYVEEGSPLKLKSLLRKHRDLDVNFSRGRRRRSPLHLACCLGDDAALRLLLEHGADVLRRDRRGDTALHVAANRALKTGKSAYDDLVVPLRRSRPEAMEAVNSAGVSPQDLLGWMQRTEVAAETSRRRRSETEAEREWTEKLFGECEDEFYETFGVYDHDDFLPVDEDEEDYGDWADRIRREYYHNKNAEAQRLAASGGKKRKSEEERAREEQSYKDLQEKLQREHQEYLQRAARKEEETRRGKKRRYDEKCAAAFGAGDAELSYRDIPWPAPRGNVKEMVDVMLHGVDRKDPPAFRRALRKQQALWHPDKFAQRCGARLRDQDRQKILDTVTALSQELNALAQSLRT